MKEVPTSEKKDIGEKGKVGSLPGMMPKPTADCTAHRDIHKRLGREL